MITEEWTSTGVSARSQLASFQDIFDRTHSRWTLKAEPSQGYFAKVCRRQVDKFGLTSIQCDPVTGVRDVHDANADRQPYFCLLYFDEGECLLEQCARETVVRRNSIALWDSSRPARFQANTRLSQHSILIPHELAQIMHPRIDDFCGTSLDGNRGAGAVLLSHLRRIHRHIDEMSGEEQRTALTSVVDLLSALYRPNLEMEASTSFKRATIGRVQDYIVANLDRPDLTASMIAREFRFSPRYLHRLFSELDMTVGQWIRKRRLRAARNDLEGRFTKRRMSITEIAYCRGFSSSSHFSRSFKDEFGMSPREYSKLIESSPVARTH